MTLNNFKSISDKFGAVLVAGLSPQKLGFNPRPVQEGFVVENVAMRQVLL